MVLYFYFAVILAMDMPAELTALNITPQGALLRWTSPLSNVDNYVLTLTHNQGKFSKLSLICGLLDNRRMDGFRRKIRIRLLPCFLCVFVFSNVM